MLEENACSRSWPKTGLQKYAAGANQFSKGSSEHSFPRLHTGREQREFEQVNGSALTKSLPNRCQSIFV